MQQATAHYLHAFAQAQTTLPGATLGWLQQFRQHALTSFEQQGFPTQQHEQWKYTQCEALLAQSLPLAMTPGVGITAAQLAPYVLAESHRFVFVDGHFAAQLSDVASLPAGVTWHSISDIALAESAFSPFFSTEAQHAHGFAALNAALINGGVLVSVAAETVVDKPVQLLFVASGARDAWVTCPRVLVQLAPRAQLRLCEHYVGLAENSYFTNSVTQLRVAADAQLHYYRLQQESMQAWHVATTELRQAKTSQVFAYSANLGASLAHHTMAVQLAEPEAYITLHGLYHARARQQLATQVLIEHAAPSTTSKVNYRGIADDRGRGAFGGKIHVQPQAQRTDAQLSNKNLLLSAHAEIDTKPELEIFADDVRCSHGATVGQLDEEAWFYLRSRGLADETARSILVYAFARDIVSTMTEPALVQLWQTCIAASLPTAHGGELP